MAVPTTKKHRKEKEQPEFLLGFLRSYCMSCHSHWNYVEKVVARDYILLWDCFWFRLTYGKRYS
jgi:hypothetical protein